MTTKSVQISNNGFRYICNANLSIYDKKKIKIINPLKQAFFMKTYHPLTTHMGKYQNNLKNRNHQFLLQIIEVIFQIRT